MSRRSGDKQRYALAPNAFGWQRDMTRTEASRSTSLAMDLSQREETDPQHAQRPETGHASLTSSNVECRLPRSMTYSAVCRVASSSQGQQSSSDWPRNNAHDRHADDALISHEEPAPKEQGTCWRRPRQSSTAGKTPGTGRTPMPWPICSPRMPSSSMSSDSGGTIGRTSARLTPSASPASSPARALR